MGHLARTKAQNQTSLNPKNTKSNINPPKSKK